MDVQYQYTKTEKTFGNLTYFFPSELFFYIQKVVFIECSFTTNTTHYCGNLVKNGLFSNEIIEM